MAYDETLAGRVRTALAGRRGLGETRMFGGLCFMLNGNMLCGIHRNELMFRIGKAQHAEALARPGARPMDITGRPMQGFVFVDPKLCDARRLKAWITMAENYVSAMPIRKETRKVSRRRKP